MLSFALIEHQRSIFPSLRVITSPAHSIALALVEAPEGFDESAWLPVFPDSVLAVRLHGATMEKADGYCRGSHTLPSRNWLLQPKGAPNSLRAAGSIAFGLLFLSDDLLDSISEKLDHPPISQCLRSDLVFIQDKLMEHRLTRCFRRCFDITVPPSMIEIEGRILLIVDRLHSLHDGFCRPEKYKAGLSPNRLRLVREFLLDHLAEKVRLADLARLAGHSTKHFARGFRQSTGMPPHLYLIQLRIEQAKERLTRTTESLSEIATSCGFSDQSHFTAVFRKSLGVTPGEYRRQFQRTSRTKNSATLYHGEEFELGIARRDNEGASI